VHAPGTQGTACTGKKEKSMHRWIADIVMCVLLAHREKHAQGKKECTGKKLEKVGRGHCDVRAPGLAGIMLRSSGEDKHAQVGHRNLYVIQGNLYDVIHSNLCVIQSAEQWGRQSCMSYTAICTSYTAEQRGVTCTDMHRRGTTCSMANTGRVQRCCLLLHPSNWHRKCAFGGELTSVGRHVRSVRLCRAVLCARRSSFGASMTRLVLAA
jgi:hypothetical protein